MKKINFPKIKFIKTKPAKPGVVTQSNLEESRAAVLANGKKFRYPLQYAKHNLILMAIAIAIVATFFFVFVGWLELYHFNGTSEVDYRFTRALPLPVAEVDGVKVRYSDYLMLFRSSIKSLERQQGKLDDSKERARQREHYERQAMDAAIAYTLALKILADHGQEVSDQEIGEVVESHRLIDGEKRNEEAFAGIIANNFGLSLKDYRRLIKLSLAQKKASTILDEEAQKLADKLYQTLKQNNGDTAKAIATLSEEERNRVNLDNLVDPVSFGNLDGGRAAKASTLTKPGQISKPFVSLNGEGYFIVKLTEKTDDKVRYDSVSVRFRAFDDLLAKLKSTQKIHEYIKLKK